MTKVDAGTQRILGKNLELAQQLGGIPMTFKGPDIVQTIVSFAREYDIRIVVMGKSLRPWFKRILRVSLFERILRDSTNLDVLIVDV